MLTTSEVIRFENHNLFLFAWLANLLVLSKLRHSFIACIFILAAVLRKYPHIIYLIKYTFRTTIATFRPVFKLLLFIISMVKPGYLGL